MEAKPIPFAGQHSYQVREIFRFKSSVSKKEFTSFFSKFGFVNSPISKSEYFWLDTSTEPCTSQLFSAFKRLRIKRKDEKYWLQYKTPILPSPTNDFYFKTYEEQKWKLETSIAQKIVSQGYARSSEFPGSCVLDFARFEVFAISTCEKRKIRNGDLEIIVEQFQKAGDYCHYQLEIRSPDPVSILRFRTQLEQEVEIRKPISKLNYIWEK